MNPPRSKPPPVRRERKPRDKEPENTVPAPDPLINLEAQISTLITAGVDTLTELTERLTSELEPNERFLMAGRIAGLVGRLPQFQAKRERPWVNVSHDLSIEQRTVRPDSEHYASRDHVNE